MRGVLVSQFGPPQVLVPAELPEPLPQAGQVLIQVEFANITFVDTQIRAGTPPNPAMLPHLPVVPGNGVGGRVIGLGPGVPGALLSGASLAGALLGGPSVAGAQVGGRSVAGGQVGGPGVTGGLLGTRVVASTGGSGGYAERVAVAADALIGVPDGLAMAEAVALMADGRTAIGLMRAAEVQAGETVLVEAAAGGVGSLLVQLARSAGATVVAAASGPRKLALASDLGAHATVDYSEPDWSERLRAQLAGTPGPGTSGSSGSSRTPRTSGSSGSSRTPGTHGTHGTHGTSGSSGSSGSSSTPGSSSSSNSSSSSGSTVDVVFDGVGGAIGRAAFDLLAAGGRMWSFGLASGALAQIPEAEAARRGIRVTWGPQIPPHTLLDLTRAALAEAAAGRLRAIIGQTYPLNQAAAAHAAMEARATLGKTLLVVDPAPTDVDPAPTDQDWLRRQGPC
jgi:NADPH:quinone reductase